MVSPLSRHEELFDENPLCAPVAHEVADAEEEAGREEVVVAVVDAMRGGHDVFL